MNIRAFTSAGLALCLLAGTAAAQTSRSSKEEDPILTKRIVVTAKRLPGEGRDDDKVSANAVIITREEIEASTALTIQQLLAEFAGMIVFDNVGNGVETTVGMRGFSGGGGVAVYVDGVRVNEPNTNGVNLEFIDLSAIERIEIIPGGAAASRGSGASAGSVNIILRSGEGPGWSEVTGSIGSFETATGSYQTGGEFGPHRIFVRTEFGRSDGFRENSDYERRIFTGKYTYAANDAARLQFGYRYYDGDFGNPGALTAEELAEDREQSPFNNLDFTNSSEQVLSARWDQAISQQLSVSLLGSWRDSEREVLTTGRSAAIFGGFGSEQDNTSYGFTGQISYRAESTELSPVVTLGLEYRDDDFTNFGFFTDALGNPTFDSSDRDTSQGTVGVYGDGSITIAEMLVVDAGVRYDRVDMDFTDNLGDSSDDTEFDETTASIGASILLGEMGSLYGRYSQSFQTPTVTELFAFPLFGSNPDLVPTTGDTYEAGIRIGDGSRFFIQAALYRMDLENEVVFVITNPIFFIGENQNIGESRRTGFESKLYGTHGDYSLRAGYAYTKAENLSLADDLGEDELLIPLVPEHKFSATLRWTQDQLFAAWTAVYVGEQVMSSDNANLGPMLDSYFVNSFSAGWEQAQWGVRVDVRNIFDEEYSGRAFFSGTTAFFTPAPGIDALASVMVRF